ncbi:MAG: InlB B-repeat-containing protein [Clostridia bacterium]|nr:InlB B-repeat-containing protein [Clostridia bacterium]
MEAQRAQFRMIFAILSTLLIMVFAALFATNLVYADPDPEPTPTYTVTIYTYDSSTQDLGTLLDTLTDKATFLYSELQINENPRYSYKYYYYDATAEDHIGAEIQNTINPISLTEDVTIVQYATFVGYEVKFYLYENSVSNLLDTKYLSTFSYADLQVNEEIGYDYEYYYYNSLAEDKKGDLITSDTVDEPISEDIGILQVRHLKEFIVSIYDNTNLNTPVATENTYAGSNLKPILEMHEETGCYFVYADKNNNPMTTINVDIYSDLKIIRHPAFRIRVWISDYGLANKQLIRTECVIKNGQFDILNGEEPNPIYDYFYFVENYTENKGDLLKSNIVSLKDLNSEDYVKEETIEFNYSKQKLDFILSNNCDDQTKTVTYSLTYGTLFSAPSRDGYTFDGWEYEGKKITKDSIVEVKSDHELVASWTPNTYKITYVLNNGKENIVQDVVFDKAPKGYVPEKEGYTFSAFTTADNVVFSLDKPYTIPGDVTLYATYTANQYDISFVIDGEEQVFKITYNTVNVLITTDKMSEYLSKYVIIGMYYFTDNKAEDGTSKSELHILTQSDRIVSNWTIAENIRAYISAVPKATTFNTALALSTMKGYNHKIEIDGVILDVKEEEVQEETDENRSASIIVNEIGNHTLRILDSTRDNKAVYTQTITITEELGIADNTVYDKPIIINEIVAKVYVGRDENSLELVDPKDVRLEKQGTYYIKVEGVNGYTSMYKVVYENAHIMEAWVLFGISGGIMMLIIILVIVGRRKVISYVRND